MLIVNSSIDNINFVNNKSILIMYSIKGVDGVYCVFFDDLFKILKNLGEGEFSFEFYFYININSSRNLIFNI